MIKDVIFFANGMMACCDEQGQQVPEEQVAPYIVVLKDKLSRGVVDEDTMVMLPWEEARKQRLGEIMQTAWWKEPAP